MTGDITATQDTERRYMDHPVQRGPLAEGKGRISVDLDTTTTAHVKSYSITSSSSSLRSMQDPSGSNRSLQLSSVPVEDGAAADIQDVTVVAEDESEGKLQLCERGGHDRSIGAAKPCLSPVRSQTPRPNLQLNIVAPNPDHMKASMPTSADGYSPAASQRFGAMQAAAGNGRPLIPKSAYYCGPPAPDSAFGTPPVGQIGVHHPREIIRIERDYTGGEVIQFAPTYPLELEGRLTPTQFLESINAINETLISAHSLSHSFIDNLTTVVTMQLSRLFLSTHFEREMKRLGRVIEDLNVMLFNPVGLNIVWPASVAFLYLEIEYY